MIQAVQVTTVPRPVPGLASGTIYMVQNQSTSETVCAREATSGPQVNDAAIMITPLGTAGNQGWQFQLAAGSSLYLWTKHGSARVVVNDIPT